MTSGKLPATLIPGDGIGPEIVQSAIEILDALGQPFDWDVQQGGLAAIEDGQRPVFASHLAELEAGAVPVGQLAGFNYSRGRREHITFYRVTPAQQVTEPPSE